MKKNTLRCAIILFFGFAFMLFVGYYATSIGKVQDALIVWHLAFTLLVGVFICVASGKIIKEVITELEKFKKEIISHIHNLNK